MKQTKSTKKAASTFGMASKLGMEIRQDFKVYLGGLYDSPMSTRMTNQLNQILIPCRDPKTRLFNFDEKSFSKLGNFDYNLNSLLNPNLREKLTMTLSDEILKVTIPELRLPGVLIFPANSSACELTIGVSLFRLSDGLKVFAPETKNMVIKKTDPVFQSQEFDFKAPDGCFCIVSVFLKFYDNFRGLATVINSKKFSPAGICAAILTPGTYKSGDGISWVSMKKLKFKLKK